MTTIDNWTGHVSGATALFQLQGVRRLEDESGMRMFSQLRNQIVYLLNDNHHDKGLYR